MKYGIRYKYTDKLSEYEDELRGYCYCVLILIHNKKYSVKVYSMNFLTISFNDNFMCHHFSDNIVIVSEVTKAEIKKTLDALSMTDFFDTLGCQVEINNELSSSDEEIEINYINNTDEYYNMAWKTGFRDDVIVRIGKKKYKMNIMRMDRILQDYGYEIRTNGYYLTKPNLIIVHEMYISNINNAIYELYQNGYFKRLGSLEEDSDWGIFEYLHSKKKH